MGVHEPRNKTVFSLTPFGAYITAVTFIKWIMAAFVAE